MSKEIIIDGVNEAEYAFYKLGVCISPINKNCRDCNDIDINNCYYKQLKRLQAENEELKKEIKSYKCQEKFPNQCHCAFRCLGNEFCQDADKRIDKYRKALEEIREILKGNKDGDIDEMIDQISEVLNV